MKEMFPHNVILKRPAIETIPSGIGARSTSLEKKEISLKDVFWHQDIKEISTKIRENRRLDPAEREVFLSSLVKKAELENFSKKKPESFKETLTRLKEADPKVQIEIWKEELKTEDEKLVRDYINLHNLSQVAKLEELNPPPELKKFADKVISLNHLLDFDTLKELSYLKPNKEQMKILERMAEMSRNSKFPDEFSRSLLIGFVRASDKIKYFPPLIGELSTFFDEDKFRESKKNTDELEKKLGERGIGLSVDFLISTEFNRQKERIMSEIEGAKIMFEQYNLPNYIQSSFLNFLDLPIEAKKTILSDAFTKKVKEFKVKVKFSDFSSLYKNKDAIFKKEKAIKKIISELKIEEMNWFDFENILLLPRLTLNRLLERDFSQTGPGVKEIIKPSPIYKEIASEFIENVRKTKGDYQARTFPSELLEYISSSLVFSYLSFEKPQEDTLSKLKEKNPEIHKKILHKDLHLEDIIPGKKATEKLIDKENLGYLAAAQALDMSFDLYGIIGKDLDGIKKAVDRRAKKIIKDYAQNKKEYLSHIGSLLGYGARYPEAVNEILKLKGNKLWEYKFDHIEDLKKIVDGIKDIEFPIEGKKEKEDILIFLKNLEEHLTFEKLSEAKSRINSIKEEKNRNKAEDLINKAESVTALLSKKEIPERKDIDNLLSNKAIFEKLGLGLTLRSIKETFQKMTQKEKEEVFLKSVRIVKEPAESLSAMDQKSSCMKAGGDWDFGALTVVQSPILILAPRDTSEKIAGKALLIPIKDEAGKWRFELKDTYGAGGEYVKEFAQKLEQVLREKNKDYYQGVKEIISEKVISGQLPKSKKLRSLESLKFYRDGKGEVEFEEVEENSIIKSQ